MITYTVEGRWPFPLDMLRYDDSRAANPESQALIDRLSGEFAPDQDAIRNKVVITLTTNVRSQYMLLTGSAARWESFGWRMIEVNGEKPVTAPPAPPTVAELEARLQQTWKDQEAMRDQEKELMARLMELTAEFQVGDVVASDERGAAGKLWEITARRAMPDVYERGKRLVYVTYTGAVLKKDGTPSKSVSQIYWRKLRKATPEELVAAGRKA